MGCEALEQGVYGSGRVITLGGIQKMRRCGAWGRGLVVDLAVLS